MSYEPLELLRQLVALPSVNPRLTTKADPAAGESRVTAFLQAFAEQQGWPWLRQQVEPGRENFLALVGLAQEDLLDAANQAQETEKTSILLFEAHQDTVGIEGMTVAPFEAKLRDGRIYGRGACDVKGGLAAMLAALSTIEPVPYRQPVLLACTVNEECGFTGVRTLSKLWSDDEDEVAQALGDIKGTLLPPLLTTIFRPTAAIISEPTELNVVVAHRGVVRWQVITHGRAAHSSQPEKGENAIYAMASVIEAVRSYEREVLAHRPRDQRCGGPTVSVTTIQGGTGPNTVPESATVNIDRRLSPDEAPEQAWQEIIDWIGKHSMLENCRIEHAPPWMQSHGLPEGENLESAQQVVAIATDVCGTSELTGVPYGANAATLAAAGIPSVVFGPGSIDQAHTADEWINVEQLEQATEVYRRLAVSDL